MQQNVKIKQLKKAWNWKAGEGKAYLIQIRAGTDVNVSSIATRGGASAQNKDTGHPGWTGVGSLNEANMRMDIDKRDGGWVLSIHVHVTR